MANDQARIPVIYLFHEGKIELGYLQSLARNREIRIVPRPSVSSPVVLLSRALQFAIEHNDLFADNPDAEIWVVFDYDSKAKDFEKARTILMKCPDPCKPDCMIRNIKRCEYCAAIDRIHVAFMSPCIEIWGLLCTEEGSRIDKISEDRHELQRLLHKFMPRYDHKRGAQFDLDKMTKTKEAIKRAKGWCGTHGNFPECLQAPHYAGIYPLVEKILSIQMNEPQSWRRRR